MKSLSMRVSLPLNRAQIALKTAGNPAALYVFAVSQARENFKKSLFPSFPLGSASKEEQRGADWSCPDLTSHKKNGRKKDGGILEIAFENLRFFSFRLRAHFDTSKQY